MIGGALNEVEKTVRNATETKCRQRYMPCGFSDNWSALLIDLWRRLGWLMPESGPIASLWPCADHFRSCPMNRHRRRRPVCFKGANNRSRRTQDQIPDIAQARS
jgi:hypothetical protein